jgi:hypothetical protein
MDTEAVPIELFVEAALRSKDVEKLIGPWRIESQVLSRIVVKHIREMGIFTVQPGHRDVMLQTVVQHLKHSPEILALRHKLESEEKQRRMSRHAE